MKKLIWILPLFVIALAACDSGETSIEKYPDSPDAKSGMSSGAGAENNIPSAAKDAMGGK